MGLFAKLLGKKQRLDAGTMRPLPGIGDIQSADEQAATRRRMEAELDTQRERRDAGRPPQA